MKHYAGNEMANLFKNVFYNTIKTEEAIIVRTLGQYYTNLFFAILIQN